MGLMSKLYLEGGLALMKLGNLEKAHDDFTKAREVEPNNKDIDREIGNLEKWLLKKTEGEEAKQLRKDHEKGVSLDNQRRKKEEKQLEAEEATEHPSKSKVQKVHKDQERKRVAGAQMALSSLGASSLKEAAKEIDGGEKQGLENPIEKIRPMEKSTFFNKKNPTMRINISLGDMEKLKRGKELFLYQPHTNSFMKVRTFPKKQKILMETPHNQELREAEVPNVKGISLESPHATFSDSGLNPTTGDTSTIKEAILAQPIYSDTPMEETSGITSTTLVQDKDSKTLDAITLTRNVKQRLRSTLSHHRESKKANMKGRGQVNSPRKKTTNGATTNTKSKSNTIYHAGSKRRKETPSSLLLSYHTWKKRKLTNIKYLSLSSHFSFCCSSVVPNAPKLMSSSISVFG